MRPLQLEGKKYFRLQVLNFRQGNDGARWWKCQCDCGKITFVRGADLKRGYVKSCGCWNSERTATKNRTHNLSKTRFYRIWQAMKDRCLNSKNYRFVYYGQRGIKVCRRWLRFENFRDDLYKSYLSHVEIFGEKNTSIDRINNNGNYEIKNCQWATQKEQVNNSRKVIKIKK